MKCRICGCECAPGARICRDCAAARKRAFAATVTQPLLAAAGVPSVGAPRFAPRPVRARPSAAPATERETPRPEATPALPLNVVPRRPGVGWLLIALAVASAIVYLVIRTLAGDHGRNADDAGTAASPVAAPPVSVTTPAAPSPAEASLTTGTATSDQPAAELKSAGETSPRKSALEKTTPRKSQPRPDTAKSAAIEPPPPPELAPVAAAPAPTPPLRAVEAPRLDPWQAMNDALLRCAREDLFSRPACEQRLRLQYCPGYWGSVPQCPIGPATDHGQ